MDNSIELKLRFQLEKIVNTREGMLAENKHRLIVGHSLAYGEESFLELNNQIDEKIKFINDYC